MAMSKLPFTTSASGRHTEDAYGGTNRTLVKRRLCPVVGRDISGWTALLRKQILISTPRRLAGCFAAGLAQRTYSPTGVRVPWQRRRGWASDWYRCL